MKSLSGLLRVVCATLIYRSVTGAIYYDAAVVLGHEGAGIIERVGEDVTDFQTG